MYKLKLGALVLFASTFAGAQSVTVGTMSSVQNGTTTTITVPVSVAVPPTSAVTTAPALASFSANVATRSSMDGNGLLTVGAAFTTIPIANIVTDSASAWNPTTNSYVIPTTGNYLIVSHVRLMDSAPKGINYGQGVNSTNTDDVNFVWSTTGTNRNSIANTSIVHLDAGTAVRLFMYADSSTPVSVYSATLSIQQLP